jgi:hypothetical protein
MEATNDNARATDADIDDDDIITAAEAARMLSTRIGTLAAWRSRKVGPPWIQLSARMPRYSRRQVAEWLAARTRIAAGGER